MNIMILVPRVVQSYISRFPETTNNAYKYFNYDRRVVDERAEHRFDVIRAYKGPEDLTDQDYDMIVAHARTLINPMLDKYSHHVACEEALHMAIWSFDRGFYQSKINADKYNVLLNVLEQPPAPPPMSLLMAKAKKKAPKEEAPVEKKVVIPRLWQKRLRLEGVPVSRSKIKAPIVRREPGSGKVVIEPSTRGKK